MSIIVKGVSKPIECPVCPFASEVGYCNAMPSRFCGNIGDWDEPIPEWCPITEVEDKEQ